MYYHGVLARAVADVDESGSLACAPRGAKNEAPRDHLSKPGWENGDGMCETMGHARAPGTTKKRTSEL